MTSETAQKQEAKVMPTVKSLMRCPLMARVTGSLLLAQVSVGWLLELR
jgi:hypothetical protein